VAIAGFVWSGVYDIGADAAHTRPVYAGLQALRERSIDTRAAKLQVPADLADPARIRQGAGNYDAMCTGCHLAPGAEETELSRGLYPKPPKLSRQTVDPARAFWVIKHGIKASGMPAWGKSMEDEYIWGMVAFLQELPKLDATRYRALVASSGGHSHGGNESAPQSRDEGGVESRREHNEAAEHPHQDATAPVDESKPHTHAPGTSPHHHDKPSEPGTPATPAETRLPEHEHH
jgi:mono/diheme cytochrome c family protein